MLHRLASHVVAACATHGVVGDGIDTVEADLDVEVIHGGEPLGLLGIDERAVGGELHTDVAADRVVDEFEEVAAHHRFATSDVDVEHLQVVQFVEDSLGLGGGELTRVALAARRQAVHTLQVARIGDFPCEADGCIEPGLQLAHQ